jgi:transcriptional regulator with XRE-family HTH domain
MTPQTTNRPNRVRFARQERILTQAELGQRVGLSQGCLSDIETGQSPGHWRTRRLLARELDRPLEWLFPDEVEAA